MKQYTSCFIGVPLPEKHQQEFEGLLANIGKLYPNWEITYPKTPHITVYYLDKQSQYVLPAIASIVKTNIGILINLVLTVNSFDYFTKEDLREGIVFLDIVYPPEFADFHGELKNKLNHYYSADNNLPFHPHMTVARVNGINNDLILKNFVLDLESKIDKVNWKFTITEVAFYGVDSTKHPQQQEKLIHIPIK